MHMMCAMITCEEFEFWNMFISAVGTLASSVAKLGYCRPKIDPVVLRLSTEFSISTSSIHSIAATGLLHTSVLKFVFK